MSPSLSRVASCCTILATVAFVVFLVLMVLRLAAGPADETLVTPMMLALGVSALFWVFGGLAEALIDPESRAR